MLSAVLAFSLLSAPAADDYATARDMAQKDHGKLIVAVGAPWCAPCRVVHRWFSQLRLRGHFAYIDRDIDPATAREATLADQPIPRIAVYSWDHGHWVRQVLVGVDQIRAFIFPKVIFNAK